MSRKQVLVLDKDKDKSPSLVKALREIGFPNAEFHEVSNISDIPRGISPHLTILDLDHSLDFSQIPPRLLNNGSNCVGIATQKEIPPEVAERLKAVYSDLGDLCYFSSNILKSPSSNKGRVGFIGMGKIGESLITQVVERNKGLGVEEAVVYSGHKDDDEGRVGGIIQQLAPMTGSFPIYSTNDLSEIGKNSEVIVVTIGKRESTKLKREDHIGRYFKDIKGIMEGLKDSEATILMATNPVTPNCLVADIYSEDQKIVGFTRLDYMRAKYLLKEWLKTEESWGDKVDKLPMELDILGPHGLGLLVTNIRIGGKGSNPVYTNKDLSLYFGDYEGKIEKLSRETAIYGELTNIKTSPERTPAFFALQIVESLGRMLNGGRDTAAVDVPLSEICRSGLKFPRSPTYTSYSIVYGDGGARDFKLDSAFEMGNVPHEYRKDLLSTLRDEERRFINYLTTHRNGFGKLREHFEM
tara:strand:+ start:1043 stop:2446 length:1404 start_codon:yes stop_codon:yes gene_type:complete